MENVTKALMLAFAMLIFVIGFSFSMYLINKLTSTANVLLEAVDTTNYYDNLKVTGDNVDKRIVGLETIIPTIYRYYKEQYSVKILNTDGKVIQLFDLALEGKMASAAANTDLNNLELVNLKNSMYNVKDKDGNKAYMFEAPWVGNASEHARTRIDYFLNGTKGYINNQLVDYSDIYGSKGFIKYAENKKFEERFIEYVYSGETITTSDEEGNERIRNNNWKHTRKFKNYDNL